MPKRVEIYFLTKAIKALGGAKAQIASSVGRNAEGTERVPSQHASRDPCRSI